MKQILIFGEKPHTTKLLSDVVKRTWPLDNTTLLSTLPFINPGVSYPRGVLFSEYPFTSNPVLSKRTILKKLNGFGENEWTDCDLSNLDFDSFDEIVFACDPDHTAAIAFYQIIEKYLGSEAWHKRLITAVRLESLDAGSIEESFADKGLFIEMFSEEISYGKAKRYFDWNWNLNSIPILGFTLRYAGCKNISDSHLSKYSLQLFHYLLEHEQPLSQNQLLGAMSAWKGTGKYPVSNNFGSVASRWSIIELLSDLGLIETHDTKIYLTSSGRQFSWLLHKDTKDFDLPTRIDLWCKNGLESSKSSIDSYIKTFFGKQLKLLNKPGAKNVWDLMTYLLCPLLQKN